MIRLALALASSILAAGPAEKVETPEPPTAPASWREAGLRGLIYDQGRWVSPDEVVERDRADARLGQLRSEYETRRANARRTVEGQRALAVWCDHVGLEAEARAHFLAVVRLDPDDIDAHKRLGQRRRNGRWMTEAEIAAEDAEADAQAKADRSWGPRLAAWRGKLADPERRPEAIRALADVKEPRAVPSVRKVFGEGEGWEQSWAVQLLGRIDAPESSLALAELAVFGADEKVRQSAVKKLRPRDPRPFVGLLINWLHEPIRYEALSMGSAGLLRVEGTTAIVERFYSASPRRGATPGLAVGRNRPDPGVNRSEAARKAVLDRQRDDSRAIDRANYAIELTNLRVEKTLQAVTGVDHGKSPGPWAEWWTGELGYSYQSPPPPEPKPVVQETVSVAYVSPPAPLAAPTYQTYSHHNCFGKGTPVLTRAGSRPIEDLKVGDQVLCQDTSSGELAFRPILTVYHNKPTATLRVEFPGETIVATPIHRFWKVGQGWAMARDLRPGDRVRTLGGQAEVLAITKEAVQPVFNLEVAESHSFFVGRGRALVHDNGLVAPTRSPFDAETLLTKPGFHSIAHVD